MSRTVRVSRANLAQTRIDEAPLPALAEGAIRLRVESFSVTANNVTYAVMGDGFGYWNFFPAGEGEGTVPMWGHAVVEESRCSDVSVGERVYGYLPMGTHLDVIPGNLSAGQFQDMAPHRQPMSIFYNLYSRLAADPEHDPAREDARMIFGPLFKTGFLIEAFMRRESWFGAQQCVMTSASSKTAMALAHCVKASSPDIKRIGLTSPGNLAFVEGTGLYDQVLSYDDLAHLPQVASVSVDFAGNGGVLRGIHEGLSAHLKYSCTVGATHVASLGQTAGPPPGPTPTLFFAPDHATALVKEMGPQGFAKAVGAAWTGFLAATEGFLNVEHRDGAEAAAEAFVQTLAGRADPAIGIVVRP